MRRQLTKISVIALLVIVLLGALVPVAEAAPDTQAWYLTSDGKLGAAPAANDGQTHDCLQPPPFCGGNYMFGTPRQTSGVQLP